MEIELWRGLRRVRTRFGSDCRPKIEISAASLRTASVTRKEICQKSSRNDTAEVVLTHPRSRRRRCRCPG